MISDVTNYDIYEITGGHVQAAYDLTQSVSKKNDKAIAKMVKQLGAKNFIHRMDTQSLVSGVVFEGGSSKQPPEGWVKCDNRVRNQFGNVCLPRVASPGGKELKKELTSEKYSSPSIWWFQAKVLGDYDNGRWTFMRGLRYMSIVWEQHHGRQYLFVPHCDAKEKWSPPDEHCIPISMKVWYLRCAEEATVKEAAAATTSPCAAK